MEWGSVSDWFSTAANIAMAACAIYAAINAKEWITQRHFDETREFIKIMTRIDDKLCKYIISSEGGDLEYALSLPYFYPADEQIKIIGLLLSPHKKIELDEEYKKFRENRINSWIEARNHSNDPDHVYKTYPGFYLYLKNLK
ncbi:hypothetical protein ABFE35_000878 [Salmonella enterica]|nr:hypothetical protein [Salmonella enterica]EDR6492946.1 hypothetical protein [Salmonella enterica subsp. diarizonae]EJO9737290.1 hypothetical protein [Salmonella enterica]EJO9830779.1 hypothetical protein [Salmonella enterica]EJP1049335.1 hypothetical protein [Salmonella enterica]